MERSSTRNTSWARFVPMVNLASTLRLDASSFGANLWLLLVTIRYPTLPYESPENLPELAKEYPLTAVTGIRVYSFFHSAWTNIPSQRKLYPDPFVLVHPEDALKYGITDGEWITISSPRGKIISKAMITYECKEGCVFIPRPGWRDECKELGLPGYGWDKANGNVLVPSNPAEPGYGATAMRSSLCKIEAGRGDM